MEVPKEVNEKLASLKEAWKGEVLARRRPVSRDKPWLPPYVYASSIRSCTRAMALDLLHPEDRKEFDVEALERMERGNQLEAANVARMIAIGARCVPRFRVVEQQVRFEVKDRDGVVLIVGKVDGRLQFFDAFLSQWEHRRPPFEVKSGKTFENCESIEDLDRGVWTRHAVDQLLSYLLGAGEPWGFFVILRPGFPTFIPVVLGDEGLERAERVLVEARAAVDARAGRTGLPDFTKERANCLRCDHLGKSCTPPEFGYEGYQTIVDPDLVDAAVLRESTFEAARQHERADKLLKERLRGVEHALLGPFEVDGKWSKTTSYDVPSDVKEKFRHEDPKGRFNLSIKRVLPLAPGS